MRAEELLQARSVWCGGTVWLYLAGRLRRVHLDLTGLTFCDGTGLRTLRRVTDAVHAANAALCLAGIHPNLHRTPDRLGAVSPWPPPLILR